MLSERARRIVSSLVDFGWPLGLIIGFLLTHDMVKASWGLVAGAGLALAVGYGLERRIAPMPLIAGVMALVFGTLALVFHDPKFVYMKPTVTSALFGVLLIGGVLMGYNPLKIMLNAAFQLPDPAWRILTWRYALFFLLMAALNEAVWRTQSQAVWLMLRFPVGQILHVVFALAQVPFLMKFSESDTSAPTPVE